MNSELDNIREKKALLRKEILKKRSALTPKEQKDRSEKICRLLLDTKEYKKADTILLYKAYNSEVITDAVFDKAIADGKTVAYPRSGIVDGEPVLSFYITSQSDEFAEGYKGILEPEGKAENLFKGSADICIAPGVAFDRKCHRIGYGKAFYDRYIRINAPKTVIGLAYDLQIAEDFETEETDCAVDMVVSESAVYKNE